MAKSTKKAAPKKAAKKAAPKAAAKPAAPKPIKEALSKSGLVAHIAEATAVLRRIAVHGADLAICHRFSKLEAHGGGFRDEMLDLMQRHIPLLTIVPQPHLAAWREFTGGLAAELPPERSALEVWFATSCPQPREAAFH